MVENTTHGYEESQLYYVVPSAVTPTIAHNVWTYENQVSAAPQALAAAVLGLVDSGNVSITETFSRKTVNSTKSSQKGVSARRRIDGVVSGARGVEWSISDVKLQKNVYTADGGQNYAWPRFIHMAFHDRLHDHASIGSSGSGSSSSAATYSRMYSSATASLGTSGNIQTFSLIQRRRTGDGKNLTKHIMGCQINEISLKSATDDFLLLNASGFGTLTTSSFLTDAPISLGTAVLVSRATAITTDPLMFFNTSISEWADPNRTEATGITEWEWSLNNNLSPIRVLRSTRGEWPVGFALGPQEINFNFTKNYKQDNALHDDLVAETKRTFVVDIKSGTTSTGRIIIRDCEKTDDFEQPVAGADEIVTQEYSYRAVSTALTRGYDYT